MRSTTAIALVAAFGFSQPPRLHAQTIVVGDGWEAFPAVEYLGGHAAHARKTIGTLVLTDSTIGYYPCNDGFCSPVKGRPLWKEPAYFVARLESLTEVQASSRIKPAGVGGKLLIGFLASDTNEEMIGLAFESETTAEAPVFKTKPTQAGAIEAKIKFRLKKMGRPLTPADTAGTPSR
jgi:hypothetical protein